jgi:3-oxoacyl-[acyl-carrier-protein] synthase III
MKRGHRRNGAAVGAGAGATAAVVVDVTAVAAGAGVAVDVAAIAVGIAAAAATVVIVGSEPASRLMRISPPRLVLGLADSFQSAVVFPREQFELACETE